MSPSAELQRFARSLLQGASATRTGERYVAADGRSASARDVAALISAGVLDGDSLGCRANTETAGWLRRMQLERDAFAAQHRVPGPTRRGGPDVNLAESPLARLAGGPGPDGGYLERHHVEAGERVRRLVDRARLQPRLTMSYAASNAVGGTHNGAADIPDLAADARKALAELHRVLPRDCAGVVLDVCGLLKGLQQVERERGWPRRSAKLVLRIGLEHLAQHYGLAPVAVGAESRRPRRWMDAGARPEVFG